MLMHHMHGQRCTTLLTAQMRDVILHVLPQLVVAAFELLESPLPSVHHSAHLHPRSFDLSQTSIRLVGKLQVVVRLAPLNLAAKRFQICLVALHDLHDCSFVSLRLKLCFCWFSTSLGGRCTSHSHAPY